MSDGSVRFSKAGEVTLASTTDEQEQIDAARPIPEGTYADRVKQAIDRYPDFMDKAFANVELYEGVKALIIDHPNGPDLQIRMAKNPKLAQELRDLPVHLSMAKAGALLESFSKRHGRVPAFENISE